MKLNDLLATGAATIATGAIVTGATTVAVTAGAISLALVSVRNSHCDPITTMNKFAFSTLYALGNFGMANSMQTDSRHSSSASNDLATSDIFPLSATSDLSSLSTTLTTAKTIPKQATAKIIYPDRQNVVCSGVLINKDKVITAQHCTFTTDSAGYPYKRLTPEKIKVVLANKTHEVSKIIRKDGYICPYFKPRDYMDLPKGPDDVCDTEDIAMLHLSDNASPASVTISKKKPETNQLLKGYGWGQISYQDKTLAQTVKQFKLKASSTDSAGVIWVSPRAGGSDSCNGDSGGGLFYKGRLVGILSLGSIYCDGTESQYVDLTSKNNRAWIRANKRLKR